MHDAIRKAGALIEALNYIRQFRDKTVVVKLGGSLMEHDQSQRELLTDVVFMATVGMRPILVHGGGKSISAAMEKSGIQPQFVQGRRYTDERTLAIAEHVLVRQINSSIVASLNSLGASAIGLHSLSACCLLAERTHLQGEGNRKIDIGLVGDIVDVNAPVLRALCKEGTIPVIAPIALDRAGGKLNVNADTAAGMVGAAIRAGKLVMMSDTHGIFHDPKDDSTRMSRLSEEEVSELIDKQIISGGMLPKVHACLTALKAGVGRTHIIDGSFPHSLLLEIYTDKGVGTLITR